LKEKDGVARLRMNRPEAFNAISLDMARELYRAAAYGRSKALLWQGLHQNLEAQLENERQGVGLSAQFGEYKEGVSAFVEKRKPNYSSVV